MSDTHSAPLAASLADIQVRRRALRDAALHAREALPPAERARLTARLDTTLDALCATLDPAELADCWPYRGEPDLRDWIARWLQGGPSRRAALPVVTVPAAPMRFRAWTPGAEMAADRHGILYPAAGETVQPDAVLVPLTAFDARGFRLGYGGGYFDRTLAAIRPMAVGVGFELSRVDSVLPQPHDCPMDWIVTESGLFRPDGEP